MTSELTTRARPMPRVLGTLTPALCAFALLFGSGCAHHVYSPPTRMMPIEDAFGPSAGGVNVGVTGSESGTVFGPSIAAAGLHLDVGVGDQLDVVGETTWMTLTGSGDAPIDNPRSDGAAGRAGIRLTLSETPRPLDAPTPPVLYALALTSGFGGGATAVGTYIAPDVGLAFSLRSRTGFDLSTGVRTWTSVPIVRRTFAWSDEERSNDPAVTFGAGFTIQGGVPLIFDAERRGEPRLRAVLGVGLAYVGDGSDHEVFMQVGGGLEARIE